MPSWQGFQGFRYPQILVTTHKEKLGRFKAEGLSGNPHKRFCEEEIFGADIMPFAVHLTAANLAAMDVAETIEHTQIIQGDSLELAPGVFHPDGTWQNAFPVPQMARKSSGEEYEVTLKPVDCVLMNPPFTKVERGIKNYVDMTRYESVVGGEVGLWGHFIRLADLFLQDEGVYGAVLPINILRGRESAKVREFTFEEWTPRYILKPTMNYGFSEWAEYRDIILVAEKKKPRKNAMIKICLIKKDLNRLTEEEIEEIGHYIRTSRKKRSDLIDIDSRPVEEMKSRMTNMMWFISGIDLSLKEKQIGFVNRFTGKLNRFPEDYFREGYRPVPKGVSKFMFITRSDRSARAQQAFLRFRTSDEAREKIAAQSLLGVQYDIDKRNFRPSLRTTTGLVNMDISNEYDFIACEPYAEYRRVKKACGYNKKVPASFWDKAQKEFDSVSTNIVVVHRINPFSPNQHLTAFYSDISVATSNMQNVILEQDPKVAKAVCVMLNSILFFTQFFLLKEESTGRYINIRFYDLHEMSLYPDSGMVPKLNAVFSKYKDSEFPSICEQFDVHFHERYNEFWEEYDAAFPQGRLWSRIGTRVEPAKVRLKFDKDVCKAVGVDVAEAELINLYDSFVKEMIITRGLKKD